MKSLVIYFSHTGENYTQYGIKNITEGNTEVIAKKIASICNADLFKVESEKPYPYNYRECCDYAKEEWKHNFRPVLKNVLKDISSYEVIYIGGPVWWSHFPMPMFTCLEKLDFKNKIIMPFATHEGSHLGSILEDVRKLCSGAKIKNGLAIYGSDVHETSTIKKLNDWMNKELN